MSQQGIPGLETAAKYDELVAETLEKIEKDLEDAFLAKPANVDLPNYTTAILKEHGCTNITSSNTNIGFANSIYLRYSFKLPSPMTTVYSTVTIA